MREIRFHGRGGQGTVVASKILAVGIAHEGGMIQAFPNFGVERRGAPVTAFLRVNEGRIFERARVVEPDHVVVLDPSLIKVVNITAGMKRDGWIIINSEKAPHEFLFNGDYRVATIDANRIAVRHGLGSKTAPIVNTAILGAVTRVLRLCSLGSLKRAITEEAPRKIEENIAAAVESYESMDGSFRG